MELPDHCTVYPINSKDPELPFLRASRDEIIQEHLDALPVHRLVRIDVLHELVRNGRIDLIVEVRQKRRTRERTRVEFEIRERVVLLFSQRNPHVLRDALVALPTSSCSN